MRVIGVEATDRQSEFSWLAFDSALARCCAEQMPEVQTVRESLEWPRARNAAMESCKNSFDSSLIEFQREM